MTKCLVDHMTRLAIAFLVLLTVPVASASAQSTASTDSVSAPSASDSAVMPAASVAAPGNQVVIGQPMTFDEQMKMLGQRAQSLAALEPATTASSAATPSAKAASASGNSVQALVVSTAPAEIQELARALKEDPDLIYEYVYDNVATLPIYGSLKGPVGALIDGSGTAFDQAELLIALLNEAALYNSAITNPQFVFGKIWLTQAQIANWLGSDGTYNSTFTALTNGGFATSGSNVTSTCASVGWAWVQVTISGTVYSFDPAAKLSNQIYSDLQNQPTLCGTTASQPVGKGYTRKTGINVATATGYTQAAFLSSAQAGSTITTTTVQGINRANVRGNLTTYANNLINWIRTNMPAASTADIVGGSAVAPLTLNTHQRWTTLPYAASQAVCAGGGAAIQSTIPACYRIVLQATLQCTPHIPLKFNTSDLYGHRLTFTLNSANQEIEALDGVAQATATQYGSSCNTTIVPGAGVTVTLKLVPLFGTAPAQKAFTLVAGNPYLLANGWGPVSRAMIEKHRRLLLQAQAANPGNPGAEAVVGEGLAMLGYTWLAEVTQNQQMTGALSGVQINLLDSFGFVGIKSLGGSNSGPFIDLPYVNTSFTQLAGRGTAGGGLTPAESAAFFTAVGVNSVLESGMIEQTQPGVTAVSTVKLLDQASDPAGLNDTIYDINNGAVSGDDSHYWVNTIKPLFSAHYTGTVGNADLMAINNLVNSGERVIAALHGPQTVNLWTGDGYFHIAANGGAVGGSISGGLSGGSGTVGISTPVVISNATLVDALGDDAATVIEGSVILYASGNADPFADLFASRSTPRTAPSRRNMSIWRLAARHFPTGWHSRAAMIRAAASRKA